MLGNTIAALADQQQHADSHPHQKSGSAKRRDYVSYRNSKLTHVLKPCLGGNAQTYIVAAIHLGPEHLEETLHTLRSVFQRISKGFPQYSSSWLSVAGMLSSP